MSQPLTPTMQAAFMTEVLFGHPNAVLPATGARIRPYFESLTMDDAWREYRQIQLLPKGFRLRDMMERMEEDGRG